MDYITAEQFLKQSEKVRKCLLEYANKANVDMLVELKTYFKETSTTNIEICLKSQVYDKIQEYAVGDNNKFVILCNESFLRHFIEEKTGSRIDIICDEMGYNIRNFVKTTGGYTSIQFEYVEGIDLLQAYWQVACKIAEGESN